MGSWVKCWYFFYLFFFFFNEARDGVLAFEITIGRLYRGYKCMALQENMALGNSAQLKIGRRYSRHSLVDVGMALTL